MHCNGSEPDIYVKKIDNFFLEIFALLVKMLRTVRKVAKKSAKKMDATAL